MAFDPRDLAILAYANGFTLWHYATADPAREVTRPGYFDEARELVEPGDMIMANTGAGAGQPRGTILVVADSRGESVAVSDMGRAAARARA